MLNFITFIITSGPHMALYISSFTTSHPVPCNANALNMDLLQVGVLTIDNIIPLCSCQVVYIGLVFNYELHIRVGEGWAIHHPDPIPVYPYIHK